MSERVDVVVVGAGVAGLATARELARAGRRPLVLERFEVGHARGSSHGTARIARLANESVDGHDGVRERIAAFEGWRRLERDTAAELLTRVGSLDFGTRCSSIEAALSACDLPAELLEPDELERRFPAIAHRGERALFQPDSAIVRADVVLSAFARDALAHGAELRTSMGVERLEQRADAVVLHTSGGELHAQSVVVATGPWIVTLAEQAGAPIPARPTLQTAVHLELRDAPLGSVPVIVEQDPEGRMFYALPQPEGGVVKGGLHAPGAPLEVDGHRDPEERLAAPFRTWAAGRYNGLGEVLDAYGCSYTWLPGDRFHIARSERVVVVSCCSGGGFMFMPLFGARAAALAQEPLD